MIVVLEGPDGGGKSTLAQLIGRATGMRVQGGSGPPREAGEIERRLAEYLTMTDVIFDRHPAVSQPIYGQMRGEAMSPEFWGLVGDFYATKPMVVYCRSTGPDRHRVKPGEDPDHIRLLTANYVQLSSAYDVWAASSAHLIYRIGDSTVDVVRVVQRIKADWDLIK